MARRPQTQCWLACLVRTWAWWCCSSGGGFARKRAPARGNADTRASSVRAHAFSSELLATAQPIQPLYSLIRQAVKTGTTTKVATHQRDHHQIVSDVQLGSCKTKALHQLRLRHQTTSIDCMKNTGRTRNTHVLPAQPAADHRSQHVQRSNRKRVNGPIPGPLKKPNMNALNLKDVGHRILKGCVHSRVRKMVTAGTENRPMETFTGPFACGISTAPLTHLKKYISDGGGGPDKNFPTVPYKKPRPVVPIQLKKLPRRE